MISKTRFYYIPKKGSAKSEQTINLLKQQLPQQKIYEASKCKAKNQQQSLQMGEKWTQTKH